MEIKLTQEEQEAVLQVAEEIAQDQEITENEALVYLIGIGISSYHEQQVWKKHREKLAQGK